MARISVIIPTHNRARLLPRAIESAKAAGQDVEIIVVDDASADETPSVCADIPDIIYLRMQNNVGLARARNAGIRRSTGEYIAFLDDDDLRLPGSLDLQAAMLDQNRDLGFVYGPVHFGDTRDCVPTGRIKPEVCPGGDIFWRLVIDNFIYVASVMVRRTHMETIGLFAEDVPGTEDWDAWLRLAAISPVDALPEPVAIYREPAYQSEQMSSHRPSMCMSGVRTQMRALRSPRALARDQTTRKRLELNYRDSVWDNLVREGYRSLSDRQFYYASLNFLTAIRLHPRRAANVGVITNFVRSVLAR